MAEPAPRDGPTTTDDAASAPFRVDVLTLFPGLFDGFLRESLIGKAVEAGYLDVRLHDFRAFATDKHATVDDSAYGGGAGMVLKAPPVLDCLADVLDGRTARPRVVLLSPAGEPLTQASARRWATGPGVVLLCGRYEGFDARVEAVADEIVSLGDYVLNGGEVGAMAIIEATARLVPGVLGNRESLREESHSAGLLEYPQYTRPQRLDARHGGGEVPAVLLSGDHAKIEAWRRAQAAERTRSLRPDLWRAHLEAGRGDDPEHGEQTDGFGPQGP